MKTLLVPFFVGLFLSACGGRGPLQFQTREIVPLTEEADFTSVSRIILKRNCVSCHLNYQSYDSVKAALPEIIAEVESGRMPKNAPRLPQAQIDFLKSWAEAGAPQGQTAPEVSTEIAWPRISREILGPKCIQCHNPNGQAQFLDLSTRAAIWKERARLLNFENPSASYLVETTVDPEEPMPPVWSNLERLNDREVALLVEWIGKGIP